MPNQFADLYYYKAIQLTKTYSWSYPDVKTRPTLAIAVAQASDGSSYVTGGIWGSIGYSRDETSQGDRDAYISKFSQEGNLLWSRNIGGTAYDEGLSLATDEDSSVYVAGITKGNMYDQTRFYGGTFDGFITKLSSDGRRIWTRIVGSEAEDWIDTIAIKNNQIVVAGNRSSTAFASKFDSSGNQIWSRSLGNGSAKSACIGKDGSIVIVGDTTGPFDGLNSRGDFDVFAIKLNQNGDKLWSKIIGTSTRDEAENVIITDDNKIIIAGNSKGSLGAMSNAGNMDIFLAKLDEDGQEIWYSMYGEQGNETATHIGFEKDGSLSLMGFTDKQINDYTFGYKDGFIALFDQSGQKLWNSNLGEAAKHAWPIFNQSDGNGKLYFGGAEREGPFLYRFEFDRASINYNYQSKVTIEPSAYTVNEGDSVDITLVTENIKPYTKIHWKLTGTGLDSKDLTKGVTSKIDQLDTEGRLKIGFEFAKDKIKEGDEVYTFIPYHDETYQFRLGPVSPVSIIVKDTSIPDPTYKVQLRKSSINEGEYLIADLASENLVTVTTLYYRTTGVDKELDAEDFGTMGLNELSGNVRVTPNGPTTVQFYVMKDLKTEGSETFKIEFSTSSDFSTIATSASFAVNDTSVNPPKTNGSTGGTTGGVAVGGGNGSQINTQIEEPTKTINDWNTYKVDRSTQARDIVTQWFGGGNLTSAKTEVVNTTKILEIVASTWSDKVKLTSVGQASTKGGRLDATQIEFGKGVQGSVLNGDVGNDTLWGRAGWDFIDGRDGDDNIHGGNGRDILTGGNGRDELWGDFGWNTFTASNDGFSDLIVVKSDQHLSNWLLGGAGNNPDGSKCDIIESLDSIDKIKILGVATSDLSFRSNVSAQGTSGIGIYAKGALEALYTAGDLSLDNIKQMTTGDLNGPTGGSYGVW